MATINELPEDERPRERLIRLGAKSLSTAELLALFFRVGGVGYSAIDLGRDLMNHFPDLNQLSRTSIDQLTKVRGIGKAKACELLAAFELGNRAAAERATSLSMNSPEAVLSLLGGELRASHQEHLKAVLVDTRHRLIRVANISQGSLNESIAHPREIIRPALLASAYGIILVHNHPSGDPTPSQADKKLTTRINEACDLLQVHLVDHIIVGSASNHSAGYFSFRESGLI